MSGIFGMYCLDGKRVSEDNLKKMSDILTHRGSDDFDLWQENYVALGHRMLWTTPESLLEKLPSSNQTKELIITADARIDNRQELLNLLDFNNIISEKITDSQLILASYEKWGENCVDKLLGDFAFAIWDKPKQLLFCARDHFGIKPFYYYHSEQDFVFASEIKGIFCIPTVPRQLNETRVGDFLTSTLYDKQITFYKNILRLPPAHTMSITKKGIKIKCYWKLDSEYELKLNSDEEYAAKFREIFEEAVRCRLRSAFPNGSMLSGGLDSSSITCMAAKLLQENFQDEKVLHTFSCIFDRVPKSDERSFIYSVVSHNQIEPYYIQGDKISPLSNIEKVLWHQDEPQFAGNLYLNWKTYELAKKLGVRVILDGFDGDNTVSHGVGYMRELARNNSWIKLVTELWQYCQKFNHSFTTIFLNYFQYYYVERLINKYKITRFINRRIKNIVSNPKSKNNSQKKKALWSSIINPDFLTKIGYSKHRKKLLQDNFIPVNNQRHEHFNSLNSGILYTTLEVLDRTAAAFSTELRYPFWDKRLVEFCLSIPANQKMQQGWTRMILRRGMEDILPKEIQWRKNKGNLSAAFEYGLDNFDRELLKEVMLEDIKYIQNYVDTQTIDKIFQKYTSQDHQPEELIDIWKAGNLALWFKQVNQTSILNTKEKLLD